MMTCCNEMPRAPAVSAEIPVASSRSCLPGTRSPGWTTLQVGASNGLMRSSSALYETCSVPDRRLCMCYERRSPLIGKEGSVSCYPEQVALLQGQQLRLGLQPSRE